MWGVNCECERDERCESEAPPGMSMRDVRCEVSVDGCEYERRDGGDDGGGEGGGQADADRKKKKTPTQRCSKKEKMAQTEKHEMAAQPANPNDPTSTRLLMPSNAKTTAAKKFGYLYPPMPTNGGPHNKSVTIPPPFREGKERERERERGRERET